MKTTFLENSEMLSSIVTYLSIHLVGAGTLHQRSATINWRRIHNLSQKHESQRFFFGPLNL